MTTTLLERGDTRTDVSPAQWLRETAAAVRVSFTWLGVRKTLTPEQKNQAAESFGAFLGGLWLAGGDPPGKGRVLMVGGSLLFLVCAALMPLAPLLPRQLARTGALDLRDTQLGPAGVQAFVAGNHLRQAVALNLAHNHIGDAGVTALAVADLPRLRELDLAGNNVTDDGAAALAGAPFLGRLTALGLADNLLSPAGHVALMASPYWHWKTVIDVTDNHPPEAESGGSADDAPIPLDYEEE